jgi:hypothetical protein
MGQWTGNYGRPTGSEKFYLQVQPPLNVEKVLDAARVLHPEKIDWLLYSGDGCEIPDCSVTQGVHYYMYTKYIHACCTRVYMGVFVILDEIGLVNVKNNQLMHMEAFIDWRCTARYVCVAK